MIVHQFFLHFRQILLAVYGWMRMRLPSKISLQMIYILSVFHAFWLPRYINSDCI